jgi:hypothetical protein
VGVGLGVVALVVLPSGTPAVAPGAYGLVVAENFPIQTLNISEQKDSTGESVFDFQVTVAKGGGFGTAESVLIYVNYPKDQSPYCVPPARCHLYRLDYLPLQVTLLDDHHGTATVIEYSARVILRGPPLGFNSDDTSATAQLPAVQLPLAQQYLIGAVEVHYTIANASSYDWTTGPPPVSTRGDDVSWYLSLQSQGSSSGSVYESISSSAGAVNQAAQQHEQFLIFLAGALVGVAGGP